MDGPLVHKYYHANLVYHTISVEKSDDGLPGKMEYIPKITIFGLKMMVKSVLEKIFLKFLHVETFFFLLHREKRPFLQNHKFNDKNDLHGGIAKKIFVE